MSYEDFSLRVLTLKSRHNLTTPQLAAKTGITPSSIYAYEAGKYYPDFRSLIKLAHAFGVTTDFLCGLEDKA